MNLILFFLINTAIQVFYYLFFYQNIDKVRKKNKKVGLQPSVSVLMSVCNEAHNLKRYLPYLLHQHYPDYELIIIDDYSTDSTLNVLESFREQHSNLKILRNRAAKGKKTALNQAILSAQNEYLLFTDADCYPNSTQWISQMQSCFSREKELILGYGGYQKKDSLVNKWIRFETVFIALQYLTFAQAGFAYMGVGRNLAYKKSLFLQKNGFQSHLDLASGDDDLFVSQAVNRNNVALALEEESFTYSEPKISFKEWFAQKQRHLTTSSHYPWKRIVLLSGEILSRVFFYLTFVACISCYYKEIFEYFYLLLIFAAYLLRMTVQFWVFRKAFRVFKENDLLFFAQMFDILLPLFYCILFVLNFFTSKQQSWK